MNNIPEEYKILIINDPRKLTYFTRPLPPIGDSDVLIKTRFSGVSHGTEMNVYGGMAPHFRSQFDRGERLFIPCESENDPVIPERGYFISNFGAEFHHNRITLKGSLVDLTGPDLSATHSSFTRRVKFVCENLPNLSLAPLISDMIPFELTLIL